MRATGEMARRYKSLSSIAIAAPEKEAQQTIAPHHLCRGKPPNPSYLVAHKKRFFSVIRYAIYAAGTSYRYLAVIAWRFFFRGYVPKEWISPARRRVSLPIRYTKGPGNRKGAIRKSPSFWNKAIDQGRLERRCEAWQHQL